MAAILEKLRGGALASLKMAEAPFEQSFKGGALLVPDAVEPVPKGERQKQLKSAKAKLKKNPLEQMF